MKNNKNELRIDIQIMVENPKIRNLYDISKSQKLRELL
jgi:hypothetical protein